MGFLDNAKKEFGKKTGKALGNKLYGRHADDVRVAKRLEISHNNGSDNSSSRDYEAIEKAKRKTLAYEQNAKLLTNIMSIEFNSNDKDSIIKELTTLSSCIDLWLKESNKNLNVTKSKFDTGLAILSTIDSQNPMVDYFANKQLEWIAFTEKRRKNRLISVGIITAVVIILVIVLAING